MDSQLPSLRSGPSVTDSEKANLCDWLCENGTPEDFQHFNLIFDLVEEALDFTWKVVRLPTEL